MKKSYLQWGACILCLVLFTLFTVQLAAQTDQEIIQNAEWSEYELGQGVVLKTHHFSNLFGGQQDVYVTEADMNTPGVSLVFRSLADGTRKTVPTWAGEVTNAAAAINGAWTNPSTGLPDQFLRINGVNLAYTNPVAQERGGIVIASDGAVSCQTKPAGGWDSLPDPNIMASEVPSVDSGSPYTWTIPGAPDYDYYYTARHPRSAAGVTADNKVLFVVVDGRNAPTATGVTYEQVAELMIALGATDATELDGGGSSTMWGRYYGVANNPSDGSPRSVASAVCIVAPAVTKTWNAEFVSASYNGNMTEGDTQTITMTFKNTGSGTWDSQTQLGASEPRDRTSSFYDTSWLSATRPCSLNETSVAPGANGTFTFEAMAPDVAALETFIESFAVVRNGEWMGLDQNRLSINVMPEGTSGEETIIIESRSGGQNFAWYSDSGMADSGTDCTAAGLTSGIGSRYGSTYRSIAGFKSAQFTPYLAEEKEYDVYVTWCAGSNRRSNITYRVVHADGSDTSLVDQSVTANEWHLLGRYRFVPGNSGYVEMTNESVDLSGSMYASAARFVPVPEASIKNWELY